MCEPTTGACTRRDTGYCDRCDLLVGLDGLHVMGVERSDAGLTVTVESEPRAGGCRSAFPHNTPCPGWSHDTSRTAHPTGGAGPLLEPAGVPTSFIPDTNTIESVNARIRKAVKARGHFPTETAALKCVYMAIMSLDPTGTGRQRWSNRWKEALNAFTIAFPGRMMDPTK